MAELVNTHPHDEYPVFDREGSCLICQRDRARHNMKVWKAQSDHLRAVLQDLTRAGEATVTAGHPTGDLFTSLVWAQEALREQT